MQDVPGKQETASPVDAAASPSPSAGSDAAASSAGSFAHYSCKLIALDGWDTAAKVEKRLQAAGITFRGVTKRKGTRETTADVYFDSEEQMKEQCAKMSEMRDAPRGVRPQQPTQATPAEGASTDAAPADAAAAAAPASAHQLQGKFLFKVRQPSVTWHPAPWQRPADTAFRGGERDNAEDFKRGKKRQKVQGAAGDIGFVAREGGDAEGAAPVEQNVNDIVAPLWRKPYPEQLEIKRAAMVKLMLDATRRWRREYGNTLSLPHECVDEASGPKTKLFCPLEPILPSPVTEAYRNKCEFSIGYDTQHKPATGFLMGSFSDGELRVEGPQDVPHVPAIAKAIVAVFNELVQASVADGLLPYDKRDHSGFWRLLVVRNSAATKQAMLLLQVDPKARTEEQMVAFRKQLMEHFRTRILDNPAWREAHEGYDLRAIQLQLFSGVSNVAPEGQPVELLHGSEGAIHERLMGLDFRVSQSAFFQINSAQTENLYNVAARFAQLPPADAAPEVKAQHVLFDVCCGTGTIGLSLANRVGKVVGLELSAAAVEDAKVNARANGIEHAHFYVGRAEDTIRQALADHVAPSNVPGAAAAAASAVPPPIVTAIVDPPRMGLHTDVVRLLRRNPRINRLVYVSCNPASLMDNLQRFCQPSTKQYAGQPFRPIKAAPVDMFPATTHCEAVVLLERDLPQQSAPQVDTKLQTKFAHQVKAELQLLQPQTAQEPQATDAQPTEPQQPAEAVASVKMESAASAPAS